jgi:hypothetical protein
MGRVAKGRGLDMDGAGGTLCLFSELVDHIRIYPEISEPFLEFLYAKKIKIFELGRSCLRSLL